MPKKNPSALELLLTNARESLDAIEDKHPEAAEFEAAEALVSLESVTRKLRSIVGVLAQNSLFTDQEEDDEDAA